MENNYNDDIIKESKSVQIEDDIKSNKNEADQNQQKISANLNNEKKSNNIIEAPAPLSESFINNNINDNKDNNDIAQSPSVVLKINNNNNNENKPDDKETNVLKFLKFCYFPIMIILTLTALIIHENNPNEILLEEVPYLKKLSTNWKSTLIFGLNDCESFTYYENIFPYWKGRKAECICNTSTRLGLCNKEDEFNCKSFHQKDPNRITKWRSNKICKEKNDNFNSNYFTLFPYIEKSEENCPSNFRSCGIIDTLKNVLCIDKNEDCPIVNMKFTNDTDAKHKKYIDDREIKFNGFSIFFNNNPDNYPNMEIPVEFEIAENTPCTNSNFGNNYSEDYYTWKNKCYITNKNNQISVDFDYKILDSFDMDLFFSENNMVTSSSDYLLNLYYKNFEGIQVDCLKKIKDENIFKKIDQLPDLVKKSNYLFTFIIILSTLLLTYLTIFKDCMSFGLLIFMFTIIITFIFVININVDNQMVNHLYLGEFFQDKCLSEIANEIYGTHVSRFAEYHNSLNSTLGLMATLLGMLGVLVLSLGYWLCFCLLK